MNRFDNGSVSAYTPQSFQELAFVPMMKRQQHDEMVKNLAALDAIAVDPLNEHRERALQLKKDLESKLGNLSGELASKGIDGLGKEAFYKLQKERNDLIAPTGEIGIINAAKVAEAEAYKRFLTSDDAKSNSQEVNLANWKKHRQKYADAMGRDEKGNIINISDLGAVKYIDEQKMLSDARSDLGMNEKSFKQASSMLNDTGNSNGTRFTVNTSKAGSTGSNYEQVKAMADYFNKRISDPSDPFRKSLDYTGRDLNKVWDQMSSHMGMMKKYQQSNESERSYGNVDYYKPPKDGENPEDPNYEGVNVEGIPMTKNSDLLDSLNDMKNNDNNSFSYALANSRTGLQGSNSKYIPNQTSTQKEDKLLNSQQYLQLARSIQRTQKINAKSLKDPKVQEAVKKYLTENKDVTLQNKYIDPNVSKVGKLFASKEISKDKKATSELIMERAQQGAYEVRGVNGELIPPDELGKYTFTYSGDMTAKSQIGNIFGNPKQNIGARRGLLYDPDSKKSIQVYVSRGADDFDTPQWKAMNLINNITKITDTKPGLYHKLKIPALEKFGVSNFEVKYNKGSDTYNVSYKDNDGVEVDEKPMTDPQFQEYILNNQLH